MNKICNYQRDTILKGYFFIDEKRKVLDQILLEFEKRGLLDSLARDIIELRRWLLEHPCRRFKSLVYYMLRNFEDVRPREGEILSKTYEVAKKLMETMDTYRREVKGPAYTAFILNESNESLRDIIEEEISDIGEHLRDPWYWEQMENIMGNKDASTIFESRKYLEAMEIFLEIMSSKDMIDLIKSYAKISDISAKAVLGAIIPYLAKRVAATVIVEDKIIEKIAKENDMVMESLRIFRESYNMKNLDKTKRDIIDVLSNSKVMRIVEEYHGYVTPYMLERMVRYIIESNGYINFLSSKDKEKKLEERQFQIFLDRLLNNKDVKKVINKIGYIDSLNLMTHSASEIIYWEAKDYEMAYKLRDMFSDNISGLRFLIDDILKIIHYSSDDMLKKLLKIIDIYSDLNYDYFYNEFEILDPFLKDVVEDLSRYTRAIWYETNIDNTRNEKVIRRFNRIVEALLHPTVVCAITGKVESKKSPRSIKTEIWRWSDEDSPIEELERRILQ